MTLEDNTLLELQVLKDLGYIESWKEHPEDPHIWIDVWVSENAEVWAGKLPTKINGLLVSLHYVPVDFPEHWEF